MKKNLEQKTIMKKYFESFEDLKFDIFLKNNIQIFQRTILDYLQTIKTEPEYKLQDFLANRKVKNFPKKLNPNFDLSESYIKSIIFHMNFITFIKKINRKWERRIGEVKQTENIRFTDLIEEYKSVGIKIINLSYGIKQESFVNQDDYFINEIRKWVENLKKLSDKNYNELYKIYFYY